MKLKITVFDVVVLTWALLVAAILHWGFCAPL